MIVDVLGWFPTGTSFTGLTPARLMDTRPTSGESTPSPTGVTVSSAGIGWPGLDIRWRPPAIQATASYLVRYRATGNATWFDAVGTSNVLTDGRRFLTVTTPAIVPGTLYEATVQAIISGRSSQPIRAEGWVYKATCSATYSTFLSTPAHLYVDLKLLTDTNGASAPLTNIGLHATLHIPVITLTREQLDNDHEQHRRVRRRRRLLPVRTSRVCLRPRHVRSRHRRTRPGVDCALHNVVHTVSGVRKSQPSARPSSDELCGARRQRRVPPHVTIGP